MASLKRRFILPKVERYKLITVRYDPLHDNATDLANELQQQLEFHKAHYQAYMRQEKEIKNDYP
jgi:hypothetical protein